MKQEINKVLTTLGVQPVMVDVGASGATPKVWELIAQHAIYVGFDPDRRELYDVPNGQFARSIIVNEAVTSVPNQDKIHFYLTRSPYCSSTLLPDTKALDNYLFSDLFVVEGEASVHASTLSDVLKRLGLSGIDWFKTDSQGTDLRLFQSLPDELRSCVLAVDIEPGLIDAYQGEDLFVDAHREMTRQGFWLSNLDIHGAVRMRRSTLDELTPEAANLIQGLQRPAPGWCEARYLRSIEWLTNHLLPAYRYRLLWVFAILDEQYGFALDIARAYRQIFGSDEFTDLLRTVSLTMLKGRMPGDQKSRGKLMRYIGKLAALFGFHS